jgi:hypothetical protein
MIAGKPPPLPICLPVCVSLRGIANKKGDLARTCHFPCPTEMKMLDKTEQSDRAANPNEKLGKLLLLGTAEGIRPVPTVLYAMAGPDMRPVIREKSQFRA